MIAESLNVLKTLALRILKEDVRYRRVVQRARERETTVVSHVPLFISVKFCCTVWRRLNVRDIVLVCRRACSVKDPPDGKRLVRSVGVSVVRCRGKAPGQPWATVHRLMHFWA